MKNLKLNIILKILFAITLSFSIAVAISKGLTMKLNAVENKGKWEPYANDQWLCQGTGNQCPLDNLAPSGI
jgi:uncharacterized SAM-binding protein YcdF (DUF218 family)